MSITVVEKNPPDTDLNDMQVGDYGRVTSGLYHNHIVLRIWNDQVVSLSNPTVIWNVALPATDHVHIFPKGSVLTVQVGLVSGQTYNAVRDLLKNDQRINAIRAVRTETGMGLKEAKEYVDDFANQPDPDPLPF